MSSLVWTTITEEVKNNAHELYELRERKARRERIATAAMQGILSGNTLQRHFTAEDIAHDALVLADALIAELDKEKP